MKRPLLPRSTLVLFASSTLMLACFVHAARVSAQSATNDWEKAAGGKMSFNVVSVKQDVADPTERHSNFPLGPHDAFTPTGGLLSATNYPLMSYISFAYKLTTDQLLAAYSQVPKWANDYRYDIEARASGNPNKDQFRLMMQALLADKFKLAIHWETRQFSVFGLALVKPGKLGPHLRPHLDDPPCPHGSAGPGSPITAVVSPQTVTGGYPVACAFGAWPSPSSPGLFVAGARNVSMKMIATSLSSPELSGLDRPLSDSTGLSGNYDFVLEFAPALNGPVPPSADPNAPTFLEAIKEQLGLKLESTTGPMDILVIDHVEEPTQN
jgi:uncharacterized protein (TIGR03435 family)